MTYQGKIDAGATLFQGAQVLLADQIVETSVLIEGGRIAEIGGTSAGDRVVDARGLMLAPALVDLHGDAFERQMMPRPGVFFPMDTAVLETDRQLAANGIATAYHSLTLSWEPGLRSLEQSRGTIQAIRDLAPRLTVENRIQLRWETFCFEAMDLIDWALQAPLKPSIAFNDHTTMGVLHPDVPIQKRPFDQAPDFPVADLHSPAFARKMDKRAKRAGVTEEEYAALIRTRWEKRPDVPAAIGKVAEAGRRAGVAMLSHDDTQPETRAYYRALGATVSEFPMVIEAAQAAREGGDFIVFGSPNAVRGGSHIGSLAAADMVEAGLCDALASDYYYPAMLAAVARLDAEKRAPRPELWSLISKGPARAMKLDDRGEISVGQRADLVLVDWPDQGTPAIRATYVAGRPAYAAMPLGQ
ncbi:alpha-D-ribose 1-methylphosphonate 5-triphosphate diphosphatase [Thalassovita mangrovi]|uniref:Amidohydrolase family protein n=1 Tax=Thalassovita mangrovi TaxID=2692236 RepID=A0A6L8LNQ8_9RHOB|nr:alpha-D-ribose 1-methylphosphonate 5-triphosphate diphosphatase [Thalassovita mangrovi]MYM57213.1 amidohydrolase family protein [Thalassovita mangrovi]